MAEAAVKPTLEERYGQAVQATRLVSGLTISHLDLLTVAGWVAGGACERRRLRRRAERNGEEVDNEALSLLHASAEDALAPLLFRLAVEWDNVRGDHGLALRRQLALEEQIKEANKSIARRLMQPVPESTPPETPHDAHVQRYELACDMEANRRLTEQAKAEATTEYLLMLSKIGTLGEARNAMGRWACLLATSWAMQGVEPLKEIRRRDGETDDQLKERQRAQHERFTRDVQRNNVGSDKQVCALVGHILRAFLDPRCKGCNGTAKVFQALRGKKKPPQAVREGRYGLTHLVDCSACHGTGLAQTSIGVSDAQQRFAKHLLSRMEEMLIETAQDMRRFLYANGGATPTT